LTTIFQNAAVATVAPTNVPATNVPAIDAALTRKKHGWLPLLTVLFLISYGLMTMLIVEQGATIESQRALIRELLRDSTELQSMRTKAQQEKSVADAQSHDQVPTVKSHVPVTHNNPSTQIPATQIPSTQIPSTQIPSTQAPTNTPSSQAVPQHRTPVQTNKQKPQFQLPSKPVSDLVDDPRALKTI
jgi:hypothetical protein